MNKINILIFTSLVFLGLNSAFATENLNDIADKNLGKDLHQKNCVNCHMVKHNASFYTRDNHKIKSLFALKQQVGNCMQAFNIQWFPAEQTAVVNYLNTEFYKFAK